MRSTLTNTHQKRIEANTGTTHESCYKTRYWSQVRELQEDRIYCTTKSPRTH